MLEIKNLTKTYKTKGGADTKALDNISISFEETGLVFLLGKSGSGKSTLLNLAGGLDAPTSGEVIVMGKSSKDFSESDFDSYRNTFIGFIFQEYNVLDEFSVEDNVALALELQGKPKDRKKIGEILRAVELEAFAKRRPNTLSGGQKQRIAIARALVKDPQIIMADEPTGALDSATGKQVFDTLKRLSQDRLVIVVSHDREFAEIYGDRIVELKDGKIISDVKKRKIVPAKLGENLTLIGSDTIAVKKGTQLTSENFEAIRSFIEGAEGDIILTKGTREIEGFRRAARVDEHGARESFSSTDPNELEIKEYDGKKTKFIRSRLPATKAFKIGASGLKLKPFRLILTVLLAVVSFIMFGLSSTMMLYNGEDVLARSFLESGDEYVSVSKRYRLRHYYSEGENDWWDDEITTKFTPADLTNLSNNNPQALGGYSYQSTIANATRKEDAGSYYQFSVNSYTVLPEQHPLRNTMQGTYPQAKNEIAISSYTADCLLHADFYSVGGQDESSSKKTLQSARDLIGENLAFSRGNSEILKITGIFESGAIPEKYNVFKEKGGSETDYFLSAMFQTQIANGLQSLMLVSDAFLKEHENPSVEQNYTFSYAQISFMPIPGADQVYMPDSYYQSYNSVSVYNAEGNMQAPVTFFQGGTRERLAANELVFSLNLLRNSGLYDLPEEPDVMEPSANPDDPDFDWDEYNLAMEEYHRVWDEYNRIWEEYNRFDRSASTASDGRIWDEEAGKERPATKAEIEEANAAVLAYLKDRDVTVSGYLWDMKDDSRTSKGNYKIVGFYATPGFYSDGFYCSEELFREMEAEQQREETKYKLEADATYDIAWLPFGGSETMIRSLAKKAGVDNCDPETDVFYTINSSIYSSVSIANSLVETLSTVFLWVGVVLALFASLLLFNFITLSITNKKKEIGILRAVGARGLDVFKIFFSESGVIVGICTLLSLIGTVILTGVINNILRTDAGLEITLFVFSGWSVLLMVGVALVVALVSTFLPVFFASRKKPVESIRAL